MKQLFFLTLPATLLLTAFFLEWLVPYLWQRYRGRKDPGPNADAAAATHPLEPNARSKRQAR
jgi:hypothetical protein